MAHICQALFSCHHHHHIHHIFIYWFSKANWSLALWNSDNIYMIINHNNIIINLCVYTMFQEDLAETCQKNSLSLSHTHTHTDTRIKFWTYVSHESIASLKLSPVPPQLKIWMKTYWYWFYPMIYTRAFWNWSMILMNSSYFCHLLALDCILSCQ